MEKGRFFYRAFTHGSDNRIRSPALSLSDYSVTHRFRSLHWRQDGEEEVSFDRL